MQVSVKCVTSGLRNAEVESRSYSKCVGTFYKVHLWLNEKKSVSTNIMKCYINSLIIYTFYSNYNGLIFFLNFLVKSPYFHNYFYIACIYKTPR